MIKNLALALASASLLAAPAVAKPNDLSIDSDVRFGIFIEPATPYSYDYRYPRSYHQRHYRYSYTGRVWLDAYGNYRCWRPNNRVGYLTTWSGQRINRWNFDRLYYTLRTQRIRCSF